MLKTIFKAVAMSAVAAFFCVGCSDKDDGGGEEPGEGGGTKSSYTITFNPNGGTVSPTSDTTGADGKLVSLPTPTRSGYDFDGWYTAQTGGTAVTVGRVYTANTTIYARWTEKAVNPPDTANPNDTTGGGTDTTGGETKSSYTVTFDANGGTVNPTSDTTDADGTLDSLPTPTREGYVFDGWFTAAKSGAAVSTGNVYTADVTIYAQWTDVSVGKYTITFDANGGTVSPLSGKTDDDGVLLISLPTPTKSGRTFDGWYTSATGGTKIAEKRVFSGDATIYARWSITITFDAGGGTVSPTSRAVDTSGKLASLPNPTRSGYIFEGWYTMAIDGDKISTATVFDSSSTIYAQWIDVTLTDGRDGKVYNRIRIGTQIWMAENLNYAADGSKCYGDSLASCAKYGRLYDWTTAMGGASSSSESPSGVQGVCPVGWHIPSDTEWTVLTNFVGTSAGKKLKAKSGWSGSSGNGTDDYGFSALPGGLGYSDGSFDYAGSGGDWWSATEGAAGDAWRRYMYYNREDVVRYGSDKSFLISVRCLQD